MFLRLTNLKIKNVFSLYLFLRSKYLQFIILEHVKIKNYVKGSSFILAPADAEKHLGSDYKQSGSLPVQVEPGVWDHRGPWLWLLAQTRAVSGSIMALVFGDDRLSLAAQAAAQPERY